MNRLQKKCVIATAGFHLLLLVILLVGPAFFNPKPKVDNSKVIDVIPSNLIDEVLNSGVKGAQPPPAPIVPPPQPQSQPTPPAPKPVVQPAPAPKQTFVQKVAKIFEPEPKPEPEKQISKPVENQTHKKIQPNLEPVVRPSPKSSTPAKSKDDSQLAKNIAENLRNKLSSPTEINVPGDSSVAYANYATVVKSVYDHAWTLPDSVAKDENITVSVTIANDGTVISSRIVTPSGDSPADASVQRTLDRVKFVAAFPDGATEKERTYTIIFNPQVKSSE